MASKQTLRDLMTTEPVVLDASATAGQAAKRMKAHDVGDVLVRQDGKLCGIVTDRDLVVRCLAESPERAAETLLADLCTKQPTVLAPDADLDEAVRLMREKAIRRIPIMDGDEPLGVVSLGDLAIARDHDSALAQISAAPPSH